MCLIPLFCDRNLGNPTSVEKHHHHHLDRNRKSTNTHSKMDHHFQHPRHTAPTNNGLIPHSFSCVTNSCGMPRFHRCQDRRVRQRPLAMNTCNCASDGKNFSKARFAQVQWRVWSSALLCILLWTPPARLMERFVPQLTCTKKCKSGRTLSDRKSVVVARFAQMEERML